MKALFKGLCFEVRNLGIIRTGEFVQKPLTVFCGPNSGGKTWAMYSLYYFYSLLSKAAESEEYSENKIPEEIALDEFNGYMSSGLPELFNTSSKGLDQAAFRLKTTESDWRKIVGEVAGSAPVFLMPAERNGLHLFFRELSARRTALLHHASREKINISELLCDVIRSRYALPIADYIDWLNGLPERQKSKREGFHDHALLLGEKLVGGVYRVDARSGAVQFRPCRSGGNGTEADFMGLHMTSGMVRSLFGLWFYLENQAARGSVLMIDEPELGIHPANQRLMARLLARLVNAGLNIVVSTHSDYIVRELNSLIMLSGDGDRRLCARHGYKENEILGTEQVAAYLCADRTVAPFAITREDGICATTFDSVIGDMNASNDDIYYTLRERSDFGSDG